VTGEHARGLSEPLEAVAQFSSAEDIAVADLRIELMYPADEATRTFLMDLPPA
jgi:hypothetical protein